MRRREFIAGLGGAAAWPLVARAQQADRVRHVGALMNGDPGDAVGQGDLMAFRQGLMELGWIEGRNIDIELRWPGGDVERAQTFAKELVGLRPDVLLVRTTPAADQIDCPPSGIRTQSSGLQQSQLRPSPASVP